MEFHEIDSWINRMYNKKIYITPEACELINKAQELITRERIVIRDEYQVIIPGVKLYTIQEDKIDAFSTKIDDDYYIFVHHSVIDKQREYLINTLNFKEIGDKEEFLNRLIEYGWLFIVFHEYAHIYCGHTDNCLEGNDDKRGQECEADMFSVDYLIKYIILRYPEGHSEELVNLYVAIYFLIANMQNDRWQNHYNDAIIQNYYDPDYISERDHPLSAQRMIYLFSMFNIYLCDEELVDLSIKDRIVSKLCELKNIELNNLNARNSTDFLIVKDSINELQKELQIIREKIPRMELA